MTRPSLQKIAVFSVVAILWLSTNLGSSALANEMHSFLSLWTDYGARDTIYAFVTDVTDETSVNYVPSSDRIAVFDNDGTLWTEQPCFIQESFVIDHAPNSGENPPACLSERPGETGLAQLALMDIEAQGKITTDEFKRDAYTFLTTADFQGTGHAPIEMTFSPMVQLLDYLRDNGFDIYICSGGGMDFVRSFAEDAYGIPPQNIVGSSFVTTFQITESGEPVLYQIPLPVWPIANYGGKPYGGKPEGIEHYIGKKPIMTVGNSDGDIAMLQYTDDGNGHDLMLLVDHNDVREFPYSDNPDRLIYTADAALEAAANNHWTVISMKDDFAEVYDWQ